MPIDLTQLQKAPRLLVEAALRPLQGERFQSTGFADLGPARYSVPARNGKDAVEMLLVESAQSVANRLETAIWDEAADDLITELHGLPYILVKTADGKAFTNSILEAHRTNSEYVVTAKKDGKEFRGLLAAELGYKTDAPIDFKSLYRVLLKYDPNSLIHGIFLEEIGGRLRTPRAVSGFIEATNIAVAESGGVKNNRVEPQLKSGEGNVPFHRTEFVAEKITAFFNLDLALLRGYALGKDATDLLISLALLKIQRFLSSGLRLRTACDLELDGDLKIARPSGFVLPDEATLLAECKRLIGLCETGGIFAKPAITELTWAKDAQATKVEIAGLPDDAPAPKIEESLKKSIKWTKAKGMKPAVLEIKGGDMTDEQIAEMLFPEHEAARRAVLEAMAAANGDAVDESGDDETAGGK